MHDASTITRRIRGIAAAGAALAAVGGCGESSQPTADGPASLQLAKPTAVAPGGRKLSARARADRAAAAHQRPQSFAASPLAKIEDRALENLQRLRAAEARQTTMTAREQARAQIAAIRDLTDAVLLAAGLEFATFDVIDGGKAVTVNVPDKDACVLSGGDATRISDRIIDGGDVVNRVKVRLVSGAALGPYLRQHCRVAKATRLGPVLLTKTDDGMLETAPFTATRGGWTIDWTSYSGVLQVYVLKNGHVVSFAANQSGRGSGQSKVTTPGTYRLQIAGTGGWKVQVRDGAAPQPPTVEPQGEPTTQP
jgi:hypothetical protein